MKSITDFIYEGSFKVLLFMFFLVLCSIIIQDYIRNWSRSIHTKKKKAFNSRDHKQKFRKQYDLNYLFFPFSSECNQ